MVRPDFRSGKWWLIIGAVLAAVVGLVVLAGMTSVGRPGATSAQATQAATPTAPAIDPPLSPTFTSQPPTPTPRPSVTPAPDPPTATAPPATAVDTNPVPTEPKPTPANDTANAPRPAVKQAPGPPLLPNGVRYGERRPNISNRVVRIASSSIKLDTSVYEVYADNNGEWEVAEYAAGHQYNSKNPGEGGNIVLSGHNNWKGEVFRYLEFLKPGNEIDIWTLNGKEWKYKVQQVLKLKEAGMPLSVRLQNARVMDPTPNEQLTLITCWPYTTYTHRLVVIATPMQ